MKKDKNQADPRCGIVGGQAVLEGVMMKSGARYSLAVRTPDGAIKLDNSTEKTGGKNVISKIPLVRGCVNFVSQLALSMKMLTKSADMQGIDLDEPETKFEKWLAKTFGDKLMNFIMGVALVLGLVLSILIFIVLPSSAAYLIDRLTGGVIYKFTPVIEGLIRMGIFVGYIALTALMKDIKRTYEYHGAEHKSVACFEAGLELTPENARGCTRFHPRCGTSFIFVILIISIVLNSVAKIFIPEGDFWISLAIKVPLLPLIVGLGYEFIRYAGRHSNVFTKIFSAPGLWMQRITTREPDDSQLEVALAALRNAIPEEFGGIVQDSGVLVDGVTVSEEEYTKMKEAEKVADAGDAGEDVPTAEVSAEAEISDAE